MKLKQITFASLFALAGIQCCALLTGCQQNAANADSGDDASATAGDVALTEVSSPNGGDSAADDTSEDSDSVSGNEIEQKQSRLQRGEMPDEWIEPQRERFIPLDTTRGEKLDLTFDDLKFDIEIGQPFERSLLSEEVKALDGKEITLSGYMKPSFKASGLKGFIFVRDDKECCFGPQAAIYDCVRVALAKGTTADFLVRPFKVRGKFYLKEREGPDGAIWSIFNMKNAHIE